jgi:23S rRNA pseudouridine1911/1915/1917 synthase
LRYRSGFAFLGYVAPVDETPRTTVVREDQREPTLAAVVRELYEGMSWSKARELVGAGKVKLGGELHFDPATRVRTGTKVEVEPAARRRKAPSLEPDGLIHVDRDVVVVRKPAGLMTVPFDGEDERDTLIERTRRALSKQPPRGGEARPKAGKRREFEHLGVVQRLDKDTSGVLVFARTRASRAALANQFRAHTIERRYVALVWGRAEAAVYDTFLVPDRGDGRRGSWRGSNPPAVAKRAITKVRIEQRLSGPFGEATLISCGIETGRQHQIRIHLSEAGHPLLGERVYDFQHETRPIQAERTMLHAASLGFRHPVHDQPLRFEEPPPPDFQALLEKLHSRR